MLVVSFCSFLSCQLFLSAFLLFLSVSVLFFFVILVFLVLSCLCFQPASARLVLACPRLALSCHVLSCCSCRFWLPFLFMLLFCSVSFALCLCKFLLLSRCSALRVFPAETRLTVYRRLSILLRSDRPSSGVREDR